MDTEMNQPQLYTFSRAIAVKDDMEDLYLTIVEYDNAIQAAVYLDTPKLGSMSIGFPIGDTVDRNVIFQGKHEQLASMMAMLLAKRTKKMIYASINIPEDALVPMESLRELLEQYYEKISQE